MKFEQAEVADNLKEVIRACQSFALICVMLFAVDPPEAPMMYATALAVAFSVQSAVSGMLALLNASHFHGLFTLPT